jgi:hypothetical protein
MHQKEQAVDDNLTHDVQWQAERCTTAQHSTARHSSAQHSTVY